MGHYGHIDEVEEEANGRRYLYPHVSAGDTVDFGAWRITITQAGIDCDCGKAAFCPYNIQTRK